MPDRDNPEWTKEDFAKAARPGDPGFPEALYDAFPKTRRRGPNKAPTKKLVSVRLSPVVLDYFKAGGPGWQSRIDAALVEIATRK